jgi:hypothetical protein
VRAESLAWLSQAHQRVKEFRREHGRRPRRRELAEILDAMGKASS